VLRLADAPIPVPGIDDVLVRVQAIGINPVDTYVRSGTYARLPALPYTPGTDAAGVVESLGSGVPAGLVPGDRVYVAGLGLRNTGTYAEYVACDWRGVRKLPDRVTVAAGAAVGVPYLTAARAVFDRASLQPGEALFVHGASGGVGLAALQFARAFGAKTFGSAGSERGAILVSGQGAIALNHHESGYEQRLLELTGGRGADVIVEMLANVNLMRDFDMLAQGGRVVIVGNRGSIEFNPRVTMAKEAAIFGTTLWNLSPAARERLFSRVDAGLHAGYLVPFVGRELPLAKAAEAHQAVMAPGAAGKIVLVT
jgi:NADPH2:quinone reductase